MDAEIDIAPRVDIAKVGARDLKLSERARGLIADGIPDNTARVLARRWADWVAWCDRELRTAMPATEESLAEYVALMCTTPTTLGKAVAPSSVEQAIAVIRRVHRDAGWPDQPGTVQARAILRGYKRRSAANGRRARQAPPITMDTLRRLVAATSAYTPTGKRDRLLLVLGLAMAGRRSELCALEVDDVEVRADGAGVTVHVRTSKTDKESAGQVVEVVRGQYPGTDPVALLRAWLEELDAYRLPGEDRVAGRLFRSIDQWDNLGEQLSPRYVSAVVRAAAERAHLPNAERYTAHSLRAGFATEAARHRVPAAEIARHGRWSPNSTVVNGYMRAVDAWEDNPTRRLGF